MTIELTRSYGKRTRDDNVAWVTVVSETKVRLGATFIDLRLGAETGTSRDIDLAYARDGRILRRVGEALHVIHSDGRSVPMQLADISVKNPTFVGAALVTQDDRTSKAPYGVFDTNTGALRGRLEHTVDPRMPQVLAPSLSDAKDGRHVWFSDVTSVRAWDVETVKCTKTLVVPANHHCRGVGVTKAGNIVTSIRPVGGGASADELLVLAPNGDVIARRAQRHMSMAVAGDLIAVTDTAKNRVVFFDEKLEEQGAAALPPKENFAQLLELWSGLHEVVAVDGHNQIHHVADASLRPSSAEEPAAAPEKKPAKKPAKK
ncbi:MAG: hypothetical protein ACXVEF_00890 [Polyangiales bacterium]